MSVQCWPFHGHEKFTAGARTATSDQLVLAAYRDLRASSHGGEGGTASILKLNQKQAIEVVRAYHQVSTLIQSRCAMNHFRAADFSSPDRCSDFITGLAECLAVKLGLVDEFHEFDFLQLEVDGDVMKSELTFLEGPWDMIFRDCDGVTVRYQNAGGDEDRTYHLSTVAGWLWFEEHQEYWRAITVKLTITTPGACVETYTKTMEYWEAWED